MTPYYICGTLQKIEIVECKEGFDLEILFPRLFNVEFSFGKFVSAGQFIDPSICLFTKKALRTSEETLLGATFFGGQIVDFLFAASFDESFQSVRPLTWGQAMAVLCSIRWSERMSKTEVEYPFDMFSAFGKNNE